MKNLISLLAEKGAAMMALLSILLFALAALLLINPPVLMYFLRIGIAVLCIAIGLWLAIALIQYLRMD